jgi:DNA mismatch repair protein MutL
LGQLLATYLVLEAQDGLLLVDQHAAHERVLYERLRGQWLERGVEGQGLLVPETVPLDPVRFAALTAWGDEAERLGFEIEAFGTDTVAVRAVPALLAGRDPASLVRNLADEIAAAGLDTGAPRTGPRALEAADRVFASLACHSARRKGEVLDDREQRALLDAVDGIPWAPTCPHGRPVFIPIDVAEIERRFGRR